MKLEKQNNLGSWSVQIDSKNFRVINRDEHKVIAEIDTFSGRGEPQVFRLHLTSNEIKTILGIGNPSGELPEKWKRIALGKSE
jgi:hypothetical protein